MRFLIYNRPFFKMCRYGRDRGIISINIKGLVVPTCSSDVGTGFFFMSGHPHRPPPVAHPGGIQLAVRRDLRRFM